MLLDVGYQQRLRERLVGGKLPPPVDVLLWHFAFGKPVDRVELETQVVDAAAPGLERLTVEELEQLEHLLTAAEVRGRRTNCGEPHDHDHAGCDDRPN